MSSPSSDFSTRSAAVRALVACQQHKRAVALAAALGILAASEVFYNRGVSRTLTSIRRCPSEFLAGDSQTGQSALPLDEASALAEA